MHFLRFNNQSNLWNLWNDFKYLLMETLLNKNEKIGNLIVKKIKKIKLKKKFYILC